MSCTTIKVTVIGSPSGVLSILDAANKAVKDAESARDESFLSRDAAKTSASESSDSARKAQASASDSAQSALKAKESEGTAQGFADDAQTSMVGAKGAMAQAKVYRDQAKQFAGQRLPVDVKHDGKTVGVGLLAIDFVGSGVDVVSTGEQQYKVTITDTGSLVTWSNLSGKPSTFPPAAHKHAISDVTGLQSALDGKQAAGSYATAAQLGQKLDASTFNSEKANFAKVNEANTFAKMIKLDVDGVADTDVANVRTVKDLIASQAVVQANSDGLLTARVRTLEQEEPASLNITANDADKTITIKLLAKGKTVASGTVDISGMFTTPSQPAPVNHPVYFGFSVSGTPDESEIKAATKKSVTKIDGQALDFVRTGKAPAYLFAWIPDALGSVSGFSSGGFLDVWKSSAVTVDGVAGKLFVSDNPTATENIVLEVKA